MDPKDEEELLEEEQIVDLPERLAMTLVSTNLGLPVNGILRGNLLSNNAASQANGAQDAPVDQPEP